ncbi:MAG: HD domain-containing protein, partial [Candidatus Thiodiazotropha sp.]
IYVNNPVYFRLAGESTVSLDTKYVEIIDTPEYQRLRKIQQLGFTHFVYPSATHTRFSHCLGVFDLCGQYVESLSQNSGDFLFAFNSDSIRFARLAALLHDIGHYPFAHYFEELGSLSAEETINFHHEHIGRRILSGELLLSEGNLRKTVCENFGEDFLNNLNLIKKEPVIRDVLDGPIDCDKVDYLTRDGIACGVPYATAIDKQRLLVSLACSEGSPGGDMQLGVTAKGIAPVESIINARYHLFSEVYWHKTCRAIAAMLKFAMYQCVNSGTIRQSDLDQAVLSRDDWSFLSWLYDSLVKTQPEAAYGLVRDALLSGNRAIYKRITTLSTAWAASEARSNISKLKSISGRGYDAVIDLQDRLISALNKECCQRKGWVVLKSHELLLDIPPGNKDVLGLPEVYYEKDTRGKHWHNFTSISGTIRDEEILARTQKIRVFVHPKRVPQMCLVENINGVIGSILNSYAS